MLRREGGPGGRERQMIVLEQYAEHKMCVHIFLPFNVYAQACIFPYMSGAQRSMLILEHPGASRWILS